MAMSQCQDYEETDKLDTMAMAREEQEEQGSWEVEVSYGGEVDLHQHLKDCVKNPGHVKFIPVDQFNMSNLPADCQDNEILELVQALTDLTVRLSVKYVSERRPKTFPDSNKPYPCYKNRGGNLMRTGTAFVAGFEIIPPEDISHAKCECQICLKSDKPETQFCIIILRTATHVVFDDLEGKHTICDFFFDKGSSPKTCSGVISINGMTQVFGATSTDYISMTCMSHDPVLIERLAQTRNQFKDAYKWLSRRYSKNHEGFGGWQSWNKAKSISNALRTLTIIVSHPHGCSKQVTVGHCTNSNERREDHEKFIYDTATCRGSSGAFVFVLENCIRNNLNTNHVHSGSVDNELNESGTALDLLPSPEMMARNARKTVEV